MITRSKRGQRWEFHLASRGAGRERASGRRWRGNGLILFEREEALPISLSPLHFEPEMSFMPCCALRPSGDHEHGASHSFPSTSEAGRGEFNETHKT